MNNVLTMKNHNVMKQYIKYICLFLTIVGINASAWGESVAASFASGTVITSDTYDDYENSDWYLSKGGAQKGAGFNAKNQTTIGNSYGTSATASHGGFYIRSKNKLSNICKITFTYDFCTTASECNNAKIYIGYSTDGSSWNAVTFTSGSQGTSIAPSEWDGSAGSSYNETTWTFEFANIASAYFAVIVSRNGSMTADKGFRFDDTQVDFYTGCCDKIVNPAKGTRTNCEIAFDLDEVPTCSSTAADRQVKVKLTPASCYAAPVKASVSSTGTTATWVSGPTWNGTTSTYDYVFQYAQNATGTTTFSASLSTKTTYTVSYNKGSTTYTGGNTIFGSHADDTKTCGTNMSLPGVTFTTTGYTQNGWTTSDGGTKVYNLSITNYSVDATATLYPSWSANETEITLDKNGGTTSGDALVDYGDASVTIVDDAVGATGYHVEGYYTNDATPVKILNADGSYAATNITGYVTGGKWTYTTASTLTLYAHWTTNTYHVRFNKNNGSATGTMADQEFTYGTSQNLTANAFSLAGNVFNGWNTQADGKGTDYTDGQSVNNLTTTNNGVFNLYAKWRVASYTDARFSCAELTLTPVLVTASTPIFITSTASKKVRSQDSIHIEGSGLSASQTLTFPDLPSVFEVKTGAHGNIVTELDGTIDTYAYIFYTPAAGSTTDGLDKITGITVSVGGTKPITKTLTKDIIGRHLPADFVIAGKKDGKWYALPDTMTTTTHPTPIEIAVDDANDPSVAYTASTNIFNLYGQNSGASGYLEEAGQYVKLGMKNNPTYANYPVLGTGSTSLGKSTGTDPTHNLDKQYWWLFTQTNTSITNPQDAKYIVHCANNSSSLSIKNDPFQWGLYASGIEELRLIPASSVVPTEAEIVAWGLHNAIVEVDKANAGGTGIAAAKVKAKLNGATSSLITLAETKTSVKNRDTKYDYTVAFGDGIDFSANEGKMLTLEWYNSSDVMIAVSNITVPRIIASTNNMYSISTNDPGWNTEVHVLPGVTLTANAGSFPSEDITIKELNIYPDATVNITTGTLEATTLVLRNGWDRLSASKKYDVARLFITPSTGSLTATNAYSDWYIDYDQYYPVAVPFPVATSSISYKNTSSTATAGVRVRYYDGDKRAKNVQQNQDENWVEYTWGGTMPTNLEPSKGYVMTAKRPTGKAFSIVRMPLTIASSDWTAGGEKGEVSGTHKDQVLVTEHKTSTTPEYAKGWNLIANPYMSLHQGELSLSYTEGSTTVEYANIPDINFKEYDQLPIETTKLKPSSAFLIQAPKTGTVTFSTDNRKASAPSSYRNADAITSIPTQRAYILLGDEQAEDMMGILVSENYTAEYETNADLEKLLSDGNTLRTYMRYANMNMAYLAINEELAKEWIPVSVRIPADGEYTFKMHEASVVGELEGVYLIDYANGDKVTNLLYENYTFTAEAGTDNSRFAINAVVGVHKTPTGLDISGTDKDGPTKFIYHDKVYILHNNVIYDSTGKRVNVINK